MRCRTLLTKNPKTKAGIKLLEISKLLNQIRTKGEKQIFLNWFGRFEEEYRETINNRTYNKDSIRTRTRKGNGGTHTRT